MPVSGICCCRSVDGIPLRRRLSVREVVTNMYHLAGGLALLHFKGWVHNDLHKGNVLQGQRWMLTDFGNSTPMCKPNGDDNELDRMM